MPRNDTLFLVDAKEARNTFLYAPATKQNGSAFLYTRYDTNGPVAMSDPDALAYATAGDVLTTPERVALNRLVLGLKSGGLWGKIHAVYPMTPSAVSSATSYALNLKNTTQHQLAIPASFVCTAEGLRNNANTTEQCSATLNWDTVSIENMSMGVYYRTYGANDASQVDIAIAASGTQAYMQTRSLLGVNQLVGEAGYQNWVGSDVANAVNGLAGSPGLHVMARLNGQTRYFVNASALATKTGSIVTQPVSGVFSLGNKAAAPISFAFVSENLTQTELGVLQSIVESYQSSLTVPRNFTGIAGPVETRNFAQAAQLQRWRHVEIVNDLVVALQAANLWPLITLLYPFVGGTAAAHSINLKSPLTGYITWTAEAVHSNLGISGSVPVVYGDTNFLSTQVPVDMGLYVTTISGGEAVIDFGAVAASGRTSFHYQFSNPAWVVGDLGNFQAPGCRIFVSAPPALVGGLLSQGRIGQVQSLYKNGQVIATSANASDVTAPNVPFTFSGTRGIGIAFVGAGFTTSQHAALYNAIQAFQVALNRAA